MVMPRQTSFTAFGGGLDLASSPMAKKPGRLDQGLNFEEVFGEQGYGFIRGYERFDGHSSPSDADYWVQPFDTGTVAIVAGDTVTNAGAATGEVVSVTLTSGSWVGGDAAGYLVLALVGSTDWADNDPIKVGGVTRALASDETNPSDRSSTNYATFMSAAREYLRAKIQKVPGEGSVLGVAVYKAVVYAVRNAVGSLKAAMYKSTAAGWSLVRDGLYPGGAWKFKVANFSGNSTQLALFGVDGRNRLCKWDGATFTKAAPIFGSEATSTSAVVSGTGAKVFTVVEAARSWQAGDSLVIFSAADASVSMTGTVTSYVAPTLTMNITSCTSAGTNKSDWEMGRTDWTDKPFKLTSFKDYLMLAYLLGQLQTSNLGNPLVYTGTAALFGLGSEITGLVSMRGAVLAVVCREKISMLTGASTTDWVMTTYSEGSGAIDGTVADNIGNALYLDDIGIISLQATQDWGNFQPAVLSRDVKKYLTSERIRMAIGSRMVRGSNQYRLYFSDGHVLRATVISGNPVLQPKDVSITRSAYDDVPTCFGGGVMSGNAESLFFGTSDGYVMQEDKGTSFDGGEINYVIRLPYDHYKSPTQKKRFHKLELELSCDDDIDFSFMQLFDYDDGNYGHSFSQTLETMAAGGQFDVNDWDTFRWSMATYSRAEVNISGVGRNMAILLVVTSSFISRAVLQGMMTHFTPLGIQR